nr:MAG TPA: hypothetical protein [Caudoviricetes sp.]
MILKQFLQMKIVYNNILPVKGFAAMNLFGIIFARNEYKPLARRIQNHEAIHTVQMKEMLYIFFYLWYLVEWLVKLFRYGRNAYENISFEREAYTYQYDYSHLEKRKKYHWIKRL